MYFRLFPQRLVQSLIPLLWVAVVLACAVATTAAQTPPAATTATDITAALRAHLQEGETSWAGDALNWRNLARFYEQRDHRPVWCVQGTEPVSAAQTLLETLQQAHEHGLDPRRYHTRAIHLQCRADAPVEVAWLELLLTDAALRYIHDMRYGMFDPKAADPRWFIASDDAGDAIDLLNAALQGGDIAAFLQGLAPTHPGYRRLTHALHHYRRLAGAGGWTQMPPGEKLEKGALDERVEILRERLLAEGDLVPGQTLDPRFFDSAVKDAVLRFQRRHGLDEDGVVGGKTLTAMNIPVEARIEQIRLALERWRWLPRDPGPRHVLVNMAAFELHVIDHGSEKLSMRVIVGRPYRSTPSFNDHLRYLVINPYWNVPPRIAREDLIPKQRKSPEYFERIHIRVLDGWGKNATELDPATVDWSQCTRRKCPYKLRQDPGVDNSLGRIKFMLPNRFDVYLHDTPGISLFDKSVRTFSSGCIRVQKPLELGSYLLTTGAKRWTPADVQALIDTEETRDVGLPEPVPIYLVYMTAWVLEDGSVQLLNDVYGRDEYMRRHAREQARSMGESAVPQAEWSWSTTTD